MAVERSPTEGSMTGEAEKHTIVHVEGDHDDDGVLKSTDEEKVDEFGAHAKTDPKEIALVRKLDMYMLVKVSHAALPLEPRC
jgi:hypothetical protein